MKTTPKLKPVTKTMKYPKINGENLDKISMVKFDYFRKAFVDCLEFDNQENEMGLAQKDIEMLAWNLALAAITLPLTYRGRT